MARVREIMSGLPLPLSACEGIALRSSVVWSSYHQVAGAENMAESDGAGDGSTRGSVGLPARVDTDAREGKDDDTDDLGYEQEYDSDFSVDSDDLAVPPPQTQGEHTSDKRKEVSRATMGLGVVPHSLTVRCFLP